MAGAEKVMILVPAASNVKIKGGRGDYLITWLASAPKICKRLFDELLWDSKWCGRGSFLSFICATPAAASTLREKKFFYSFPRAWPCGQVVVQECSVELRCARVGICRQYPLATNNNIFEAAFALHCCARLQFACLCIWRFWA